MPYNTRIYTIVYISLIGISEKSCFLRSANPRLCRCSSPATFLGNELEFFKLGM